ncbi:ThiF family adenylyltransferase [Rhizobium johnstonii]|uniref:ThiF family adenylyltransferase n=1 Tax=Rhizobium johnstonii TaxID=3019933 RepID=UPI003F988A7C
MADIERRDLLILTAGSALALGAGLPAQAQIAASSFDIKTAMHGIEGLTIPRQITVLGTGGSGCWPAIFAAMCGVEEMLLIDASDVSADDLGRTCFRPSDIGRPKAEATAEIVKVFRPDVKTTTVKRFVEPGQDDVYFGEVIFDGVDYTPLNKALPAEAQKRGMRYAQGFYKGLGAGVTTKFVPELEWTKGSESPVWPPAAALCGILQIYAAFAVPFNFSGNISKSTMDDKQLVATLVNGMSRPAK